MPSEEEKQRNREEYRQRMKRRVRKVWMIVGVIFVLLVFGKTLWGIIGVNIPYSDGERTVKIIKLAQKGLVWKTWETEGVLTQGNFAVTYIWSFSVDNWGPGQRKAVRRDKSRF